MKKPKYLTRLNQVAEISSRQQNELQAVTDKYAFRSNDYYQSLIDWNDPDDPIRRLIVPDVQELDDWGALDASDEHIYTPVPGLEHKYPSTVLLLCSDVCAGYCRYCFRKRLFMHGNEEVAKNVSQGIAYIREHKEITNVLLTGGDPLILATQRLSSILARLREIPHVKIIRIGTKLPAFNPERILGDPSLAAMLREHTEVDRKIYIMVHFDHPRELTPAAVEGLQALQQSGAIVCNQNPIIRGINDRVETLTELWRKLSFVGVPPYYVFQCRPTKGNAPYSTPIERNLALVEAARRRTSGLAKRARFVMSHRTGKIEISGMTENLIFFKYHLAARPENEGRIMVFERNPEAHWLEDYTELVDSYSVVSEAEELTEA